MLAGESGSATEETVAAIRSRFGLDLPVFDQLLAYLNNLAHFSLGFSPRYNMPVGDLIMQRLPGTLLLMACALILALVLDIFLGMVMATFAGKWPDRVLSVFALFFYSIPSFWIGLMLIVLFSVKLGWLPGGGSETIGTPLSGFDYVVDRARFMIMPALSLTTATSIS